MEQLGPKNLKILRDETVRDLIDPHFLGPDEKGKAMHNDLLSAFKKDGQLKKKFLDIVKTREAQSKFMTCPVQIP